METETEMLHRLHIRARRTLSDLLSGTLIVLLLATPSSVAAETLPSTDSTSNPPVVVTVTPEPSPPEATVPPSNPTPPVEVEVAPAASATPTATLTPAPFNTPTVVDTTTDTSTQTTSTTLTNNVDSTATSGNAQITENHRAGDATTGTASADATIVNVVGTSSGLGAPTTFVQNVYNTPGSNEIQGNITIDPSTLMPTSGSTLTTNLYGSVAGMDSLTAITNNVNLLAISGNADVNNNYKAGSATTGDAVAMANIINVVNSSVGARNTFLGVINIFGNLRGDILVPSSLVDSLFGSNATSPTAVAGNGSLTSDITIKNNINLAATSGDATVQGNYKAGDATSGNATTNLTVFNLTGQEVIAKNSLLVFVNVLGSWVGMIINAPEGSTAAALTGGGSGSAANATPQGDYNSTVNITNNVNVSATSGNATVQDNYKAGSATSGDATAGANVLNLVHTSFSLDDWFGVLFINVLGSWLGNFGIAPGGVGTPPQTPGDNPAGSDNPITNVKVFRFANSTTLKPASQPAFRNFDAGDIAMTAATEPIPVSSGQVLAAHTDNNELPQIAASNDRTTAILLIFFLALLVALAATIVRRRLHTKHR